MARGRKASEVVVRAVRLLEGHLSPMEMVAVLKVPKRSVYDLLKRVREEVAEEEAANQQAAILEREKRKKEEMRRELREREIFLSLTEEREQFGL